MAKDLVVPYGIHLVFLPAYSTELQPAERLWPIVNEGFTNRTVGVLDELVVSLVTRCPSIDAGQAFVSGPYLVVHGEPVQDSTVSVGWAVLGLVEGDVLRAVEVLLRDRPLPSREGAVVAVHDVQVAPADEVHPEKPQHDVLLGVFHGGTT
jgi:hypothetical protein